MGSTTWGSTGREVARRLVRSAIDRGARPGDRLAAEATLVHELGVSRATLREGLRLLTFLGTARSRFGPSGGTVVSLPDGAAVASSLAVVLQGRRATVRTVVEAEAVHLVSAAAMAAVQATEKDRDALPAGVERLRAAARDAPILRDLLSIDTDVARAAHNDAVEVVLVALVRIVATTALDVPPAGRSSLVVRYQDLAAAIESRDPEAARAAAETIGRHRLRQFQRAHAAELDRWLRWPDVDEALESEGTVAL